LVAAVKNGSIYLNAGQESGLEVGQKLDVFSQGAEIIDPSSGVSLGREEEKIGTLKIESYMGDSASIATVISGSTPNVKDLCRLPS
jgi:hypothetical protein